MSLHPFVPPQKRGMRWRSTTWVCYGVGIGVAQDAEEAVRWIRMAAEQGDAEGQLALGVLYGEGLGVVQDYAEAYAWMSVALSQEPYYSAEGILAEDRDSRQELLDQMTPSEVERGEELEREYLEKYVMRESQ